MILNKARICSIPKIFFLTFTFLNSMYLIQMIFKEEKGKCLKWVMVTRHNMKLFEITSKILTDGKLCYQHSWTFGFYFWVENFPRSTGTLLGFMSRWSTVTKCRLPYKREENKHEIDYLEKTLNVLLSIFS